MGVKREAAQRNLDSAVGTQTLTKSQREQAAWWGVDIDRPTGSTSTEASSGADAISIRETESVRSVEAAAWTAKESEATRIAGTRPRSDSGVPR